MQSKDWTPRAILGKSVNPCFAHFIGYNLRIVQPIQGLLSKAQIQGLCRTIWNQTKLTAPDKTQKAFGLSYGFLKKQLSTDLTLHLQLGQGMQKRYTLCRDLSDTVAVFCWPLRTVSHCAGQHCTHWSLWGEKGAKDDEDKESGGVSVCERERQELCFSTRFLKMPVFLYLMKSC